ncbi:hypothetical protein EFE32_09825 [Lactococcus lactis subsp. lactis]|uniref:hypothetical protein n=1 Tax=Lactococcus lactis TaxID=1358 RepID=UPI00223B7442|nr:hypothetical protein [Lactococcus lactis]MCT0017113.1 hypothetical protein [Lactococcus lactis subsp. lactis]
MGNEIFEYGFHLVSELEIAANFIWAGIKEVNKIRDFEVDIPIELSDLMDKTVDYGRAGGTFQEANAHLIVRENQDKIFTALYHFSIGIERVQKTILKLYLFPKDRDEDYEKGDLELLKSHKMEALQQRLKRLFPELHFEKRENNLLELLSHYYNHERYMNLHADTKEDNYYHLFIEFLKRYSKDLTNRKTVLEVIGSSVGRIIAKYYSILENLSHEKGVFVYEINYQKESRYVYLAYQNRNASLQIQFDKIRRAKQELILYLIEQGKAIYPVDSLEIDSLDFDFAELPDMIDYILNENVLNDFTDTVESFDEDIFYEVEVKKEFQRIIAERKEILDNFYK